ncbi:MAG: hypothetical protein KDK61_02050 [Simkania sp.]|nr:hypothetical protein [Simkania sp.]
MALIQISSTDNVEENFKQIYKLISEIPQNVDWVVLPENALYMRIDNDAPQVTFDLSEKYFHQLQELCKEKQFPVLLGSVPVRKANKVYNSTVVVNAVNSAAIYDKIHLFDVDVKGEKSLRESELYSAGSETIVLSREGWRFGLSICYDLRFAELYTQYLKDHVDVLLVPSAFLKTTGAAHWHVLLRARAIENQCYVVLAGNVGNLPQVKNMDIQYAQSAILTPCDFVFSRDGIAADSTPNTEMLILADLNLDALYESRVSGSVLNLNDRRHELFSVIWHQT